MKIGIFGGTFDPIHYGHLQLARNARGQFSLDKIIFVPAYQPPHKQSLSFLTSAEDRYEMVRLALGEEPFLEISDVELKRGGVSYAFDTVAALEARYPASAFFLILGKDAFEQIDTWHRASELKKKVCFLVADRGGSGIRMPSDVKMKWMQMPLCPISASGIRAAIKEGRDVDDYVSPEVLRYIRAHSLYRGN